MKTTILHHFVPATALAECATIDVFDCSDDDVCENYMLVCARDGETYHSKLFFSPRETAAAWLDAITIACM